MKLMKSFLALPAISSSDEAAGFPDDNIAVLDPGMIWEAGTFGDPAGAWLKVDFGAPQSIAGLFLNNANFTSATWQGNDTDSWVGPSFTQNLTLAADTAGRIKGFFEPSTAFSYRYFRLFIPYQALSAGSVPYLGNLIVASVVTDVRAGEWSPEIVTARRIFQTDGGSYDEIEKGIARHVITVSFNGRRSEVIPWIGKFTNAVIASDFTAADSYLVFYPESVRPRINSAAKVTADMIFKEKV